MLTTTVTRRFGLSLPVIGAPMGGVGGGELAAAVSAGGGLGMIGVLGGTPADFVREQARIPEGRGLPYGVGLMAWVLPDRPDLLDAVLELRPALVSVSFGDPAPWTGPLRDAGIAVAAQVSTPAEAERAQGAGVDILVAQGGEAGGHTGRVATLPLLQAVLEVAQVPVVAAGGIATPAGLAAVLAAGADAAWIGTALLASPETLASDRARDRVRAAGVEDTVYTPVFDAVQRIPWPPQWHGRALRNAFTDRWHGRDAELRTDDAARAGHAAAVRAQDHTEAHIYAGQAVGLVREGRPAADVVRGLADGAERLLRSRSAELLG